MKLASFAHLTAAALLTATSAFAAPGPAHWPADPRRDHRAQEHRPAPPRPADHFDRAQNYGFDRAHRVSREERYRWEAAHNYGYATGHRVSPQERARWEASYHH